MEWMKNVKGELDGHCILVNRDGDDVEAFAIPAGSVVEITVMDQSKVSRRMMSSANHHLGVFQMEEEARWARREFGSQFIPIDMSGEFQAPTLTVVYDESE
jgi:hypothetical protein